MTNSDTERDVDDSLTQLAKSLANVPTAHGNWTRAVIGHLASLGHRKGFQPCAHQCDHGEFLFDLAWLKRNGQTIEDIPLVVECEWGTDRYVVEDFEKLLLARSDHRLMIFDGTNVSDPKQLIERLCQTIRTFAKTFPGDRYLFAFWTKGDAFEFRQCVG